MNEGFISITNGNVHFRKWGTDKKLLIALHGYGADGSMYRSLSKQLAQHFTFYAVDLPFHGKTSWESNIFQPTDFQELVTSILEKEKATHCSMLGHSFGARLALKLAAEMPTYFDHLYLLSPDGIRTYGLGLANWLPPRWRKYMFKQLKRPERWLRLAEKLRHLGIISRHAELFLHRNLANSKTRKRLLATWLSLVDFRLDRRKMHLDRQSGPSGGCARGGTFFCRNAPRRIPKIRWKTLAIRSVGRACDYRSCRSFTRIPIKMDMVLI